MSQKISGKAIGISRQPFWEKAFLFFTFVLLPLSSGFFLVCQSIDRNLEHQRENVRRTLEFRTTEYLKSFAPERVLTRIFRGWAKKGTNSFQKFLFLLEKNYPETFKIIAWDPQGAILPFQGPVLSGKKMWGNIIRRFLLPIVPPVLYAHQMAADPDLKSLLAFLGKKIPLEYLLPLRNGCLDSVWLDKPCLFFQYTASPTDSAPREVAGALVFILHRALPSNFWEHSALTMGLKEFNDGETFPVAADLANPRRGFSPKGLALRRNFREDLWKTYALRPEEMFAVDRWLAMEIKTSPSLTQRVFLLSDFSGVQRDVDEKKNQARCLFLFLILLFFAFIEREARTIRAVSFRWRISGLFSLALFLPTVGFIFLGIMVVTTEKEKCRKQASEQMKSFSALLTSRFNAFPAKYGRAIHKVLLKVKGREAAPIPCLLILHALIQRGTFSSYYLSDTTGRVESFFDPQRGPKGARSLRFAVQKGFADSHSQYQNLSSPESVEVPGKSVPSAHFSGISPASGDVFQAGELRLFRVGSAETYMMTFDIVFHGEYRLLLLEINSEALERTFATFELRKQARKGLAIHDDFGHLAIPGQNLKKLAKRADYSFIRWEFLARNGGLPAGSPVATAIRHARASRRFDENQCLEGEMVLNGSPVFFNVPDFSTYKAIRPIVLFPQKPWAEKVDHRKKQIYIAVGISLGISFLLGLVLATGLLEPIKTLDSAVKEIRSGNLRLRLPDLGNNELGRLNQNFNGMANGLQERQRMRAFVSSSVLEAISEEESGAIRRGQIRTVAVLFSHVKDFSKLSAIASPQDIFVVLNEFLAGAEKCIRAFGGEVDKFIGDAVMATFLRGDREMAAVKAAVAIHDFVEEWNRGRRTKGLWTISIGIGIHSGPVMMGDLGSSRRKDLTVIGDTVNLAARLESVSDAGRKTHIILSESTFTAVKSLISAEELSITKVKGKTEAVRMFELVGVIEEC